MRITWACKTGMVVILAGSSASAQGLDLAVRAIDFIEPTTRTSTAFRDDEYDPNREVTIGNKVGLKFQGSGDKVKVDAFLEQGAWEMRGKFLSGRMPLDIRGAMVKIERPVDWFGWMED